MVIREDSPRGIRSVRRKEFVQKALFKAQSERFKQR